MNLPYSVTQLPSTQTAHSNTTPLVLSIVFITTTTATHVTGAYLIGTTAALALAQQEATKQKLPATIQWGAPTATKAQSPQDDTITTSLCVILLILFALK